MDGIISIPSFFEYTWRADESQREESPRVEEIDVEVNYSTYTIYMPESINLNHIIC